MEKTKAAVGIAARDEGCRREKLRGETILRGRKAFDRLCQEAKMERKETAYSARNHSQSKMAPDSEVWRHNRPR
jgi:hypothetical protein